MKKTLIAALLATLAASPVYAEKIGRHHRQLESLVDAGA